MLLSHIGINVSGSTNSLNVRSLPMSAMGRLFLFVTLYNKKGQTESDRVATTVQFRPFHHLYYHMDSTVTRLF